LDNGLTGLGAHNFHVNLAIAQAFRDKKIACQVFAAHVVSRDLLRGLNGSPHFSRYFYESIRLPRASQLPRFLWHRLARLPGQMPCDEGLSETVTHRRLNRAYRKDLARLPQIWKRGNIIVIPAISQNQLRGLADHLLSVPPEQLPTVFCQLMFPPEWTPWGARSLHGERFYRDAFAILQRLMGKSLFFIAETEGLAEEYRKGFCIPVTTLPLPLALDEVSPGMRAPNAPPLFAYLGYAKTERGFHLLPAAIESLAARNATARFLIQIKHSRWEREIIAAEGALRKLRSVEILQGELSRQDYLHCLNRADAVLLPYDPEKYGQRGSAVLIEAAAGGRPVVACDRTWPAQLVHEGEIEGTIMPAFDASSLARAVETLLDRFDGAAQTARLLAPRFVARHDPARYVDALLKIAQRNDPRTGAHLQ
jgi:glycosyltransferase involved in cell wall biosynthesis